MVGFYLVGYSTLAWWTFWTAVGVHSMHVWSISISVDATEVPQERAPRVRTTHDLLAEVFPDGMTL